ncbi:MAG: hypothetical protein K2M44_03555 [Clostridia bacterium]|nr:hypothetical protein [Clostridia bacterium]
MFELPKNCSYYLDKSKAAADSGDYVSAMEVLQLAFNYAETDTDVTDCLMSKIELLEILKIESLYNYYDALARGGENPEIYMRLFNAAMFDSNMPLADYYLSKINEGDSEAELELVGADEDNGIFDSEALESIGKMIKAHRERSKIDFVSSDEEHIKELIDSVLNDCIVHNNYREAVDKLVGGLGICEEYDSEIGNLAVNCAVMTGDNEFAYNTFRTVGEKLPKDIASLCNSYSYAAATDNKQLKADLMEKLHAALPDIDVDDTRTVLLAAYTLNESGDFEGAYEVINKLKSHDMMGQRIKAVILFNLDKSDEAMAILRHLELCGSQEDRLLRKYFNAMGNTYTTIGNNILNVMSMHYEKIFMGTPLSKNTIRQEMSRGLLKDAFLYQVGISRDKMAAMGEKRKELALRYEKMSEEFIRLYPEEVLPILYNENVHEMLRRNMLFYFIFALGEADRQGIIQTFSPDRKITVESDGYVYRSDILMDRRWDTYPEKLKAAVASAVADCCFERELEMDEVNDVVATLNRRMEESPLSIYSFRMLYTGAVAILNPNLDTIASIVGDSDNGRKYIKRTCRKLDIEIFSPEE